MNQKPYKMSFTSKGLLQSHKGTHVQFESDLNDIKLKSGFDFHSCINRFIRRLTEMTLQKFREKLAIASPEIAGKAPLQNIR